MPPKLVELLDAISSFLQPGCDVFVMETLVVACLWVPGLWGDNDSKVLGLVLGFDFLWGG